MNVWALDFDGVLCDSVNECAISAWRAGRYLWSGWTTNEPLPALTKRFIALRPVIEKDYQMVLLMRLIYEGLAEESIRADFINLSEQWRLAHGYSREQCSEVFGRVRDEWIAADLSDWLNQQRLYPNIMTPLQNALQPDRFQREPIFIVTMKRQRFVKALLEGYQIDFPITHIFGSDSGHTKEQVLTALLQRPELLGATLHFVEDRLATLLRIQNNAQLASVHLYLADWGYNTIADQQMARRAGIIVWHSEQFLQSSPL